MKTKIKIVYYDWDRKMYYITNRGKNVYIDIENGEGKKLYKNWMKICEQKN